MNNAERVYITRSGRTVRKYPVKRIRVTQSPTPPAELSPESLCVVTSGPYTTRYGRVVNKYSTSSTLTTIPPKPVESKPKEQRKRAPTRPSKAGPYVTRSGREIWKYSTSSGPRPLCRKAPVMKPKVQWSNKGVTFVRENNRYRLVYQIVTRKVRFYTTSGRLCRRYAKEKKPSEYKTLKFGIRLVPPSWKPAPQNIAKCLVFITD